ncbi:MAG: LamG domain-containing protein, partial [Planctomycetes bacterium]|nr:LamG domain-containing protein [Planctomycetota bacterium]
LDLEAEYFWRIAAVTGEEVTAGDIWSFTTEDWSAMIPVNTSPGNGAESLAAPVTLTWEAGANAYRHDLYISTDENLVTNLDPGVCVSDVDSPHVVADLALGMEYFWCVNAISSEVPQGIPSEVWSFTPLNYEVIEDFEDGVWMALGNADITVESNIVYEGSQSMRIDYDDIGGDVSEAVLVFGTPLDLSAYTGGKALSVMLHGEEGNSPEVMYFKLYDSSMSATVVYPAQAGIVQYIWNPWVQWHIDLGDFSGMDLSDLVGMAIGFGDGSEDGNLGTVYVDDIRLYAPRCVPELVAGDIVDEDCVAGLNDLEILAAKWLDAEKIVYAEPVSDDGLVLWFEFEEVFGTSVADSANGYTAMINGTPDLGAAGKIGNCIDFDGDGYLSLLSPAEAFGSVSDEITITMWVYGDDIQPGSDGELAYSTLFRADVAGILSFLYAQGPNRNGAPLFGTKNMSGGHFFTAWADASPDDWKNRWNHYAFVRNTNDSSLGIYCNGMLVAEKVSGEIGLIPGESMTLFWIGYFPKYHGKIDEFRVYDRALSQGEVLTLAEKTSATQPVVSIADINGDGTVNLADFASVAQNWLDLSFWPAY